MRYTSLVRNSGHHHRKCQWPDCRGWCWDLYPEKDVITEEVIPISEEESRQEEEASFLYDWYNACLTFIKGESK